MAWRVGFGIIHVGPRTQPPFNQGWLRQAVLRFGVLSFLAERLIRRRHRNDVQ